MVLAIGLPLLSQAWHAYKISAMERREVVGSPPYLATVTPVLMTYSDDCWDDLCKALLHHAKGTGMFVLPISSLNGLDLSGPVDLADLPLQHWVNALGEQNADPTRHLLTPAERATAAQQINYLLWSARPQNFATLTAPEIALRANPALSGMYDAERVKLGLAPLSDPPGQLTFAGLRFDTLDLWLMERPLGLPLAPYNTV